MTSRAWLVHRKPHEVECLEVFLAKNIVAIGWPTLDFSGLSRDAIEKRLKAYSPSRNLAKDLNVVSYFVETMRKKDLVLVPKGKEVHVGEVKGDYYHQPGKSGQTIPYRNQRRVAWIEGSPFPKTLFDPDVQRKLKASSPPVIPLDATPQKIRAGLSGAHAKSSSSGPRKKVTQKGLKGRPIGYKDEAESTMFRKAAEVKIRAIHKKLINAFNTFVEHRVTANENTYDVFIDQGWLPGRTLLIEAKSQARNGAGRHQIREAIGQLFDYRLMLKNEGFKNIDLAVLTPQKPDQELIDLVHGELEMEMIWQTKSGFRGTKGVASWLKQ